MTSRGDCATVNGHLNPNCTFARRNATTSTRPEDGTPDVIPIHEQGGLFGLYFQPTNTLRLNFNMDATYADASFTRISPRQTQHYVGRGIYKPKPWMTFSGAINIFQSRNNVDTVNYLHHANDYSFGVVLAKPDARWALDMNYSYSDVFSSILECYVSTPPPSGSSPCTFAPGYLQSTVLYNQPTNFGSIGIILNPVKRVHTNFGYRMSAVNGNETLLNPRQVPGSLQSQWQQPYFNLAVRYRSSVDMEGQLQLLQLRRRFADWTYVAPQFQGKCGYAGCKLFFLVQYLDSLNVLFTVKKELFHEETDTANRRSWRNDTGDGHNEFCPGRGRSNL